jgi:hypothetical protein
VDTFQRNTLPPSSGFYPSRWRQYVITSPRGVKLRNHHGSFKKDRINDGEIQVLEKTDLLGRRDKSKDENEDERRHYVAVERHPVQGYS